MHQIRKWEWSISEKLQRSHRGLKRIYQSMWLYHTITNTFANYIALPEIALKNLRDKYQLCGLVHGEPIVGPCVDLGLVDNLQCASSEFTLPCHGHPEGQLKSGGSLMKRIHTSSSILHSRTHLEKHFFTNGYCKILITKPGWLLLISVVVDHQRQPKLVDVSGGEGVQGGFEFQVLETHSVLPPL